MSEPAQTLNRTLNAFQITLLGLGTILGAGIYVLVGEVAAEAGEAAPVSFLVASGLAALSALCICELVSRHPHSAGSAIYVSEAFGGRAGTFIGFCVCFTGITSAATLANGFAGYMTAFSAVPAPVLITVVVLALGFITAWGIRESVSVTVVATIIEVAGLLLVVGAGLTMAEPAGLGAAPAARNPDLLPSITVVGIVAGSLLAFYAFIGFEDMVTLAEEVRNVRRVMPRAILAALGVSTVLYLAVAFTAIWVMPAGLLAGSPAPLADVFARATGESAAVISIIGVFAVVNGMLVQIIMSSRVVYGMAASGWLPPGFAVIHASRRTPARATVLISALVLGFALWLPLGVLAQLSSLAVMVTFTAVACALIRLKRRDPGGPEVFRLPVWLPYVSAGLSALFAGLNAFHLLLRT